MKRNLLLLGLLLFFSPYLFASESNGPDKWLALVRFVDIKFEEVKNQCPHFPYYDFYTKDENFSTARLAWQNKYSKEVTAFLSLPKIKKVNPSLVDLGITQLGQEAPIKFENSYWNWVEASKIERSKLVSIAPHFPIPVVTEDIANAQKIYESAIADWMILFSKEANDLFAQPELVRLNPNSNSNSNFKIADSKLNFLSLTTPESIPTKLSYSSGNDLLDQARVEAYTKKWYWEKDRVTYYKQYDPAGLEEYNSHLEYLKNTTIDKEIKY